VTIFPLGAIFFNNLTS